MDTAIIVAIVALVSTIVGATIGAATTYVLAARRERVDRQIERRNHAIEVKRAARLLDLELRKAQALADIAINKRSWVVDVGLSTEAWEKYAGVAAPDLSDAAWNAVTIAFLAIEHIEGARAFYQASVLNDRPISDNTAGTIAPMLRDVTLGREALAPFARNDPPFREAVGPMADQGPAVVKAYADMKRHADYVTAETRQLTAKVTEATALQTDASTRKVLSESRGLMTATSLFQEHVGNLIFPSRPLSPEVTEATLMAVRQGFIKAFEQVNAETKRRVDSAEATIKSVGAEKQNVLEEPSGD
jgi:hypothetical protein